MKKCFKISFWIVAALVVVALIAYRAVNTAPSQELSAENQMLEILQEGGCMSCHSATPELPFYANLPVAKNLIVKDVEEGYRAYDIAPMMDALAKGETLNPVDVAKVEKVILDNRMPMAKYYLMHWGSAITEEKKQMSLSFLTNYRSAYFNDGLEGDMAYEPVRPIDLTYSVDAAKAELGNRLFHDTRLSVDNTVSCASCHDLGTAGVDNHVYSHGVNDLLGGVNAPTVFNAVYNFVQFWDGRAATLAAQAAGPPLNPVEMASTSFDEIVEKLNADKEFQKDFLAVYPEGISEATITDAIAEFEKTLITPNSRFDKYLRGDNTALTAEEIEGYNLFKKYDCATCHTGKNLGGLTYELMGIRNDYFADRGIELTNEDNGRFKETNLERDRHRFKVPGLRNIEHTWPYFHDGTRLELADAVRDMAYYQSDYRLTDGEVALMVAFLQTLTGEYNGQMVTTTNTSVDHEGEDHHHH